MDRIKNNWSTYLSVIAIVCSIVAICVALPGNRVAFGMDYIGVLVGVLSLLVTLLIGWQIWSIISIDKKIKGEVQVMKNEIDASIKEQQDKALYLMSIINEVSQARMDIIEKEYDNALFSYLHAIESARNADLPDMGKACLDAIINFVIPSIEKEGIKITITKEEKAMYCGILRAINDNRAIDVIVYMKTL